MIEVRMRPRHQLTLPASVARQANLKPDDRLVDSYFNGSIILTPSHHEAEDLMAFAGIGRGVWGETAEAVDATLREQRSRERNR